VGVTSHPERLLLQENLVLVVMVAPVDQQKGLQVDKPTAKKVLTVLDHKIVEVLSLYVDERISLLNKKLQQSKDINVLMEAQGQIQELLKLKTIREDAFNVINNDERDVDG
jgi:hypothetical protein